MKHRDQIYCSDSRLFPIALKAKNSPKEKFNNLLHFLTQDRIRAAILRMPRSTAPGPDGLKRDEVLENLDLLLPVTLEKIHQRSYTAPAAKRVHIPKEKGGTRPIAVGNILDRGIQAATAEILNNIYEQDFLDCSWGFRPGRGCHEALGSLSKAIEKEGLTFLYEVDLENFFGTLQHGWVEKFLKHRIADKRLLALIKSWLKAGVMENGNLIVEEIGSVQGGSISPIIANIYLHYVLDLWFEIVVKGKLKGKAKLIKYADDFILAFENRHDMERVAAVLNFRLEKFGLRVSKEKTRMTKVGDQGVHQELGRSATFLGFTVFLAKRKTGYGWKVVFKTDKRKFNSAKKRIKVNIFKRMHFPLEIQAEYLKSALRGHYNYFGLPGNSYKIGSFYDAIRRYWKRVLSRRTRDKFISWKEFDKILRTTRIPTPRLKFSYKSFSSFTEQLS